MNIKILSTQIYDDYEDKQEEQHKDSNVKILDKKIVINYNNNEEIIYNKDSNLIEIKREKNTILVQLNKENEISYETPYGMCVLRTLGEKISFEESPFRIVVEYKITLNDTINYKNIIEIVEM